MSSEKQGIPNDAYSQQQGPPPSYSSPYTNQPQTYQYGVGPGAYSNQAQYSSQTTVLQTNAAPIMQYQQPAEDYMCRAIFATLCCFWPVGIFAIMKASEARSAYARGDVLAGQTSSSSARQLSNVAIGVGIASIVVAGIIVGVYVGVVLSYLKDNNKYY